MRNYFYVAFLLLTGCSAVPTYQTYSGAALPSQKIAFVKTESERNNAILSGLDKRMYIIDVDGIRPPTKSTSDVPYPESATLLPGFHQIKLLWQHMGKWAIVKVGGRFEAGQSYIIRQQPDSKLLHIWIEDASSKASVGRSSANMGEQG